MDMDGTAWRANKARSGRLALASGTIAVSVALAAYLALQAAGVVARADFLCAVGAGVVLCFSGLVSFGLVLLARDAPGDIGIGPGGLSFRIPAFPGRGRTETVPWNEIAKVEDHSGGDGSGFALVLRDLSRRTYQIDTFLQTEILNLAEGYLKSGLEKADAAPGGGMVPEASPAPSGPAEPPAPAMPDAGPSLARQPTVGQTQPSIRWLDTERWRDLVWGLLLIFALMELSAYMIWHYYNEAYPTCFIMGAVGWVFLTAIVLSFLPKRPIGLSDAGLHLTPDRLNPKRDGFVPWGAIAKVRILGNGTMVIDRKAGGRLEVDSPGRTAARAVLEALDAGYNRLQGNARRVNPADNRMGGTANRTRSRYLGILAGAAAAVAATQVVDAAAYFHVLGMPAEAFYLITIIGAAAGVSGVLVWFRLRSAPENVAITAIGIYIRYSGDLPVQATDFVAWPDLAALAPPEKGDPETDPARAVVLVKKSGAAYYIGPVDPETIGELRARAAVHAAGSFGRSG